MFALIFKAKNHRATCTTLALNLKWTTLFSYRFFAGKHINPLELESLISLLRLPHVKEHGHKRLLARVHSRVVLGAVSKGRSNSRKMYFLFRKLWFWCLACDIALELVLGAYLPGHIQPMPPSRCQPIESWYASLLQLPSYTDRSGGSSSRSPSKLDLFREPLSVAAHTAGEHVRELESSGAVSCLKTKPVYVENAPSQVIYAGESTSTPTDMRQLPRKGGKNEWKYEQA